MLDLDSFCEQYGYSKETVYVNVYNKTAIAEFVHDGYMIDNVAFEKHTGYIASLQDKAQTIYYPTRELFKSDAALSRVLSKITNRSTATWHQWLCSKLFALRLQQGYQFRVPEMMEEFIFIGSCICVIAEKKNEIKLKDWI